MCCPLASSGARHTMHAVVTFGSSCINCLACLGPPEQYPWWRPLSPECCGLTRNIGDRTIAPYHRRFDHRHCVQDTFVRDTRLCPQCRNTTVRAVHYSQGQTKHRRIQHSGWITFDKTEYIDYKAWFVETTLRVPEYRLSAVTL